MRRSRRSVLVSLAGSATLFAGCGSTGGGDSPTERATGTPTVTFATATGGTESPSPADRRTETPDAVTRATTTARTEISTAIERLNAAAVVEDGDVGIVTANAFAEYARAESPRPPIQRARGALDGVSDRATADRQRAVNGLLFLCEYLETRAVQHDRIVDGFSSFYEATQAFPTELELETARAAVGDMRTLRQQVGTAGGVLDRIAPRADALGVSGFAVDTARERQSTFRRIAREFEPAFAGALSTMQVVGLLSATGPAIERGNYERAAGFAADATVAADNATSRLDTASERNVRHFSATFERYRCLATKLRTVAERYGDAAEAYLNEAPEKGREHYRSAKEDLGTTEEECGIEL
ncbi:hypothetical protein [Haloglomus litoreum]|uniref:hypothetical protein n=1 Tax=Haloglomus litoreum TaxID=3034026 RepID=UPI0023E7B65C|nr:hypothetical protein [Haloglomus sp. DT116]